MKITCKEFFDSYPCIAYDYPDDFKFFIVSKWGDLPEDIDEACNIVDDIANYGAEGIPEGSCIGDYEALVKAVQADEPKDDFSMKEIRYNPASWICEALHIMFGKDFEYSIIHGCVQSDWAILFHESEMDRETMHVIECLYFNLGSYYEIHVFDNDGTEIDDFERYILDTENIEDYMRSEYPDAEIEVLE